MTLIAENSLLKTRLKPSLNRGEYIGRACVKTILSDSKKKRLVMLKAPAGYGKTVTMTACYWSLKEAEEAVAWLDLVDFDGTLEEVSKYLLHAFPFFDQLQGLDNAQASTEFEVDDSSYQRARFFSNNIQDLSAAIYLFLDNFDAIIGTAAESLIYEMVRTAPPNFHIILASRTAPSFGLGRLRMEGHFAEFGVEHLKYSKDGAERYFSSLPNLRLEAEMISVIAEKTQGWPAGVHMLAMALSRTQNKLKFLDLFNGDIPEFREFLSEDVLGKIAPDLIDFLIKTSFLNKIEFQLCDSILDMSDSEKILERLIHESLFVFPVDGEPGVYQYQPLFADFLKGSLKRLYPDLVNSLHLKASNWCLENDRIIDSVSYAMNVGDYSRAAEILDVHAEGLLNKGRFNSLYRVLTSLPNHIFRANPSISIWQASCLICKRNFREAEPILKLAEDQIKVLSSSGGGEEGRLEYLNGLLVRTKILLAQNKDDMRTLEDLCKEAMSGKETYDEVSALFCQVSLLQSKREQYRLDDWVKESGVINASLASLNHSMMTIAGVSVIGPTLTHRGDLDAALALYDRTLSEFNYNPESMGGVLAGLYELKAELLLEKMEFEAARSIYDRYYDITKEIGFTENLTSSFVGRARLAAYEGDVRKAERLLNDGIDYAASRSMDRLKWSCVDELLRQYARRKNVSAALRLASDMGLPKTDVKLYPVGDVTTSKEILARSWSRAALADGRPKEALKLLKRWTNFVGSRGFVRSHLRMSMLMAEAYQALGDIRAAKRSLNAVVPSVIKSGFLFNFVEDSAVLKNLIAHACGTESNSNETTAEFAERIKLLLVSGWEKSSSSEHTQVDDLQSDIPNEPLNAKEIEILDLISRSMLNKEIATRLGLTEGTVKWYLQQIYDKLGVRRRLLALEAARERGYL